MRKISLDRLRALMEIAGHGLFAEATQALYLAAPIMSLHIAELENCVGAQLLSRKCRQMQPTVTGEVMVERTRKLPADAEQTPDDIQQQVQGLSGHMRLSTSIDAIAYLLPQALEVLRQDHPGVGVQAVVSTSQKTLVGLVDGTLDIGLVALPQSQVVGFTVKS